MIVDRRAYYRAIEREQAAAIPPPQCHHWQLVRRLVIVPGIPAWFEQATEVFAARLDGGDWLLLGHKFRTPFELSKEHKPYWIGAIVPDDVVQAGLSSLAACDPADCRHHDSMWSSARPDQYGPGVYPAGWPGARTA